MREPSISSVPPSYPPSLNNHLPPTYNPHPLPAEQSLLAGAVPPPQGVLSFSSKHFAVALTGQPESDNSQEHVPEYGRNGVVQGAVEMIFDGGFKSNEVAKIRLKIEGKLKLEIAEGGTHSAVFLDQDISLYPKDATDAQCPSILPFAYALPTTYHEDQPHAPGDLAPPPIKRPLPPSYECEFDGVPGLRAQVRYMIRVEVTRKKIWKRKYCLPIKFLYKPRSRPHLPGPPPNASFLATLKQSPEEWAVFSNAVPRRNDPTNLPGVPPLPLEQILQQEGETILSSLVLPATQTFPLTQQIPVHLQLSISTPTKGSSSTTLPNPANHRRPSTAPTNLGTPSHHKQKRARSRSDLISGASMSGQTNLLSLFADPCFSAPPPSQKLPQLPGSRPSAQLPRPSNVGSRGPNGETGNPELTEGPLRPTDVAGRSSSGSTTVRRGREDSISSSRTRQEGKDDKPSYIRISIQRQIVVTVRGQKVVKTIICGDGRLQRVSLPKRVDSASDSLQPPGTRQRSSNSRRSSITGQQPDPVPPDYNSELDSSAVAWEGYVLPSKDMLCVGGFRTQGLWVKDFLTLTMVPPDPEKSPLRALHHAVPIRLVSDPWEEEWWGGRRW